jgi:hypothetical protein
MGVYTAQSQIEFFRRRRHGIASRFRFLKDGESGYVILAVLTANFYLNRRFDTTIGAHVEHLIFDAPADLDVDLIFEQAIFGDLLANAAADSPFKRFTLTAETRPTAQNENRFRFLITAAFNDTTPVFGIELPPPDGGGGIGGEP